MLPSNPNPPDDTSSDPQPLNGAVPHDPPADAPPIAARPIPGATEPSSGAKRLLDRAKALLGPGEEVDIPGAYALIEAEIKEQKRAARKLFWNNHLIRQGFDPAICSLEYYRWKYQRDAADCPDELRDREHAMEEFRMAAQRWLNTLAARKCLPASAIYVHGPYGVGKSTALQSFGIGVARAKTGVRYIETPYLQRVMGDHIQTGSVSQALAWLIPIQVLILDEFAQERSFPWWLDFLTVLLNQRYAARLPTFIGSVHTPMKVEERWGGVQIDNCASTLDRLCERWSFLEIPGPSRREPCIDF